MSERMIFWVQVCWSLSFLGFLLTVFYYRIYLFKKFTVVALIICFLIMPGIFLIARYGYVNCDDLTSYDNCLCENLTLVQSERNEGRIIALSDLQSCADKF